MKRKWIVFLLHKYYNVGRRRIGKPKEKTAGGTYGERESLIYS